MDITSATAPSAASSNSLFKLSADYEAFLKLLTAQVASQDPLEPMDSSTYVTQLAQLSQVEQTVQSNERLAAISARMASDSSLQGARLIGKDVDWETDTIPGGDGTTIRVRPDAPVSGFTLRLIDSDGVVLREMPGPGSDGGGWHDISWDGTDADGRSVAGPVQAEVIAVGADGARVTYDIRARDRVDAVRTEPDGARLVLRSGAEIELDDVRRIG